jgi:hypothetical protein
MDGLAGNLASAGAAARRRSVTAAMSLVPMFARTTVTTDFFPRLREIDKLTDVATSVKKMP